jgi:peroxiredoxin
MQVAKSYIILSVFLSASITLSAQSTNDSIFTSQAIQSFKLINAAGKNYTQIKNFLSLQSILLFVFLSPECPLCKNYSPVLNTLAYQYGTSVKMIGIISGRTYSTSAVNAFAKKYKITFPLLIDKEKKLTNYLHATITPEVILLNSKCELLYKGAIDNRVKALGIQKGQATEYYLTDAITQYLQHTAIAIKRQPATGCLINDF